MPRHLRIRGHVPAWLELHRADLSDADVTTHEGLAIVRPARAIVDAVLADADPRLIDEAVQAARRRDLLTASDRLAVERVLLTQRLRQIDGARPAP